MILISPKNTILLVLSCLLMQGFSIYAQEKSNYYPFRDADGWGLKNAQGVELFSQRFEFIDVNNDYLDDRIVFKEKGKWGIINREGLIIIPAIYDDIFKYFAGYEVVNESIPGNEGRGFINLQGDTIVPLKHDYITVTSINDRGLEDSDYYVTALKSFDEENNAIFSSDGVQRTDYDLLEVVAIDSARFFHSSNSSYVRHVGIHSKTTGLYGIYDVEEKKIIVEPIFDGICVGWCYLPDNPHFVPGPIVYLGKTPVFYLELEGDKTLVDHSGNILFNSKDVPNWDDKKKYYIDETGVLGEVEGRCAEDAGHRYENYIFRSEDWSSWYWAGINGLPRNEKRFDHLSRLTVIDTRDSTEKQWFIASEGENGPMHLYDENLNKRLSFGSLSDVRWSKNLNCFRVYNREKQQREYWYPQLDSFCTDPILPKFENQLFQENNLVGIKNQKGDTLYPAAFQYHRLYQPHESYTGEKLQIYTDLKKHVVLVGHEVDILHQFEADFFDYVRPQKKGDTAYIILHNKDIFHVYDLTNSEWVLKNEPCDTISSMPISFQRCGKEQTVYFKINHEGHRVIYDINGKVQHRISLPNVGSFDIRYIDDSRVIWSLESVAKDSLPNILGYNNFRFETMLPVFVGQYNSKLDLFFVRLENNGAHYVFNSRCEIVDSSFVQFEVSESSPYYVKRVNKEGTISIHDSTGSILRTIQYAYVRNFWDRLGYIKLENSSRGHYILPKTRLPDFNRIYKNNPDSNPVHSDMQIMIRQAEQWSYTYDFLSLEGDPIVLDVIKYEDYPVGFNRSCYEAITQKEIIWISDEGVIYHREML